MTDTAPKQAFTAALAEFQADLPRIRKEQTAHVRSDKGNYSYGYADLTDVTEAAIPLLAKHGFSFTATPEQREADFILVCELEHVGGHSKVGNWKLPDPTRSTPQAVGSAITYARRYTLCAMTGIAPGGDDDEGKQAETTNKPAKPQRGKEQPPADATTDAVWLEEFRARLVFCTSPGEVRGLWQEASQVGKEGRLASNDWAALKGEMNARIDELKGAEVSA